MAVLIGATVVHRVRVNERKGIGLTACGTRFTLGDKRYDPNGAYTEEYVDWLNDRAERSRNIKCLCFHCSDREPAWRRLRREKRRKKRRELRSSC